MVLVEEAEKIILGEDRDFGTELIYYDQCLGRVLAEDILSDRELPPFNRVTMDGIAISYASFQAGLRTFRITGIQAAGEMPKNGLQADACMEIMTGASLPLPADTVIPYEQVRIQDGFATVLTETVKQGQFIHHQGKDAGKDQLLVAAGQLITTAVITVAATIGKSYLLVKKNPSIIIITTGDELVDISETPTDFQLRRSNSDTLGAELKKQGIPAAKLHLGDQPESMRQILESCISRYQVILLTGGVSMGKFDYVPEALEQLAVKKLFHKVKQKPGKPFWFGIHPGGTVVFAFPGNPVSALLCFHRYFIPWLMKCRKLKHKKICAALTKDLDFSPALQYFVPVALKVTPKAVVEAEPLPGNGSGDFVSLLQADAFLELPLEKGIFKKGECYPVWAFGNC